MPKHHSIQAFEGVEVNALYILDRGTR